METKTYYQHFRTGLKRPTTVAYRVEGTEVKYNIAECGPKDQFCRKTGRAIATGRLNKHERGSFTVTDTSHRAVGNELFDELRMIG